MCVLNQDTQTPWEFYDKRSCEVLLCLIEAYSELRGVCNDIMAGCRSYETCFA